MKITCNGELESEVLSNKTWAKKNSIKVEKVNKVQLLHPINPSLIKF